MINIQDIIPYLKNGWVAMDNNGAWWWYNEKPTYDIDLEQWCPYNMTQFNSIQIPNCFDIAPANDWTKSLMEIKNDL